MGYRVKTILSRHASSLYWIGRYQERAEQIARLLQVKYFSTMDSTMSSHRELILRSMLFSTSGAVAGDTVLEEGEVLHQIALDRSSQTSIWHCIHEARENTKGVRNLISNELWETLNKNFHFIEGFNTDYLKTRGLYEFTHGVQENSSTFHAKLASTLLHDNVWSFVNLGIYIERVHQIARGILNTLIDVKTLHTKEENLAIESYQWLLTLNTFEATDMTKLIFKTSAQQDNTCEFLITNPQFPRSMTFCFDRINTLISNIKNAPKQMGLEKQSLEFRSAKTTAYLSYLDYSDIHNDLISFLNHMLQEVVILNDWISKDFFESKQ